MYISNKFICKKIWFSNFILKSLRNMTTENKSNISLKNLIEVLEDFAPIKTAEDWDNVGLLVEPFEYEGATKIFLTNDLTLPVMQEVVSTKSNFIITYHPLIFSPLRHIRQTDWKCKIISECLQKGICIFSPHTSWDAAENGVNKWLLDTINGKYTNCSPIIKSNENPLLGGGKFCTLDIPITIEQAIQNIKNSTGLKTVQLGLGINKSMDSLISTVAVCAGSGASVLKNIKADLYLTGEMSHHDVLNATQNGITTMLLNHSNSERQFLYKFQKILQDKVNGVPVIVSSVDADPLMSH